MILLNVWIKRNLTLIGKIQILKTFALSKLIFCASVLPVPEYVMEELEKNYTCIFMERKKELY